MSGYWATGRLTTEIAPASTSTMDSTAAKIGRSMKKREITVGPFSDTPRGGRFPTGPIMLGRLETGPTAERSSHLPRRQHEQPLAPAGEQPPLHHHRRQHAQPQ